jgi:hypothetical protein
MTDVEVAMVFIGVVIGIVVLLICREIICWYNKTNEKIKLQEQILAELKKINARY